MNRSKKPDKKTGAQAELAHVHSASEVYKVLLLMGRWKRDFTVQECSLMISEALNQCTYRYHNEFEVTGYLITSRRLFLVLDKNGPPLHELLNRFSEQLRKDIHAYYHLAACVNPGIAGQNSPGHLSELFTVHPFIEPDLFKLITGQKVWEPYYNPHLERLKDYIHNYNFCSALDYSGAISPVIVKLLHNQK